MTCASQFSGEVVLTHAQGGATIPHMDIASRLEVTSAPSVHEMMREIFGEAPSLPVLDVQPAIRALNAQLRGRSAIAANRRSAGHFGQANIHAQIAVCRLVVGSSARQYLPPKWWRVCRIELGLTGSLAGLELVQPHATAEQKEDTAIGVLTRHIDSKAQKARERARHHSLQYIPHFPLRAAQSRAAAADKAA